MAKAGVKTMAEIQDRIKHLEIENIDIWLSNGKHHLSKDDAESTQWK